MDLESAWHVTLRYFHVRCSLKPIVSYVAGGYVFRPNFDGAANMVLRDFRSGVLGRFCLDIDLLKNDCITDDAQPPTLGVEVHDV